MRQEKEKMSSNMVKDVSIREMGPFIILMLERG